MQLRWRCMPSVPGGGQKVVRKSVHFLMSIQWSFAGGLFLPVLTEWKGKTLSLGIPFLQTGIQQLLCSRCFWTQANKGYNSEFWFLELVCHLQKHFFIFLGNIWFEKCTVALCSQRGHKSFAVFLGSFFFSCWKASEVLVGNMSCDFPRAQGCASQSACRHWARRVAAHKSVAKLKGQEQLKAAKAQTPAATDHGSHCCWDGPRDSWGGGEELASGSEQEQML